MKMKKYTLLFLFLSFCFADCKKYEDGPCISLRTKTARLTGIWEPEMFLVNGIDSIDKLKADTCYAPYIFNKKAENGDDRLVMTSSIYRPGCWKSGIWLFKEHKKKLLTEFRGTSGKNTIIGPYGLDNVELEWDILRLTNAELWLKINYLGVEYECHFKQIYY